MAKRESAKHKIDRRLGVNLWGRPKSPYNRREYGPGQHGQRRRKPTDFGLQLRAKQQLKGHYGDISEKQFRRLYHEAVRRRGDTGENLIELLERRLDAVVYRMKFVPTIFAARQFVNHGHVRVNGRRLNIPSYRVRDGDVIEVKQKSRTMALVLEAIESPERDVPDYLSVDFNELKRHLPARPRPCRCALRRPDGAASGGGVLLPVTMAAPEPSRPPRRIPDRRTILARMDGGERRKLLQRSDRKGLVRLAGHLAALGLTGSLIALEAPGWPVLLLPHGILLAFLFCLLHEAVHGTPFRSGLAERRGRPGRRVRRVPAAGVVSPFPPGAPPPHARPGARPGTGAAPVPVEARPRLAYCGRRLLGPAGADAARQCGGPEPRRLRSALGARCGGA